MKLRSLLVLGAVAGSAVLGACSEQNAGAFVGVDEFNTGVVRAIIRSDTAVSASTAKYASQNGISVQLIPIGSETPLRTINTVNGVATFVGLEPGTYIVRPVLRSQSSGAGQLEDTVTVTASDTTASDTIRVRLGASVGGIIGAQYFDQTTQRNIRYGNVIVKIVRESAPGSNVFTDTVGVDTTDATGAFSVPLPPDATRWRIVFDPTTIAALTDTMLVFTPDAASTPTSARPLAVFTSPAGLSPNQNVSQNLLFGYRTRITGAVFRDLNNDEIKAASGENLVNGDTVNIELRNADGTRLLSTARVLGSAAVASQNYTFNGMAPGTYTITHNTRTSRFPTANGAFTRARTYQVTIVGNASGTNTETIVRAYGVPYGP